jgi:hypothetical protein
VRATARLCPLRCATAAAQCFRPHAAYCSCGRPTRQNLSSSVRAVSASVNAEGVPCVHHKQCEAASRGLTLDHLELHPPTIMQQLVDGPGSNAPPQHRHLSRPRQCALLQPAVGGFGLQVVGLWPWKHCWGAAHCGVQRARTNTAHTPCSRQPACSSRAGLGARFRSGIVDGVRARGDSASSSSSVHYRELHLASGRHRCAAFTMGQSRTQAFLGRAGGGFPSVAVPLHCGSGPVGQWESWLQVRVQRSCTPVQTVNRP